ncbi:MAG: phage major capsid protein [Haliea sp.]|uniref:phage major capsid protein n=1 Tax=Haliea sp. TaxID=1932666 RepID=UPI0032ED5241
MSKILSLSPASHYLRAVTAMACSPLDPHTFIAEHYRGFGDHVEKALEGMTSNDSKPTRYVEDFFDQVFERSIFTQIDNLRRTDFNVWLSVAESGSTAYWTGESAPAPISKMALAFTELKYKKLIAIVVRSKEMFKQAAGSNLNESVLFNDLIGTTALSIDTPALDPANAGDDERPASLTYGVIPVSAGSDIGAGIADTISRFDGDLQAAHWISHPTTLAKIAMTRDAAGGYMFPDLSPRGGSLLGMPVVATRACPIDSDGGSLILVDPSGIAVAMEPGRLVDSSHTDISMVDETDSTGPVMVNMFQTEGIALKSTTYANWSVQRAGSVAVLTGI